MIKKTGKKDENGIEMCEGDTVKVMTKSTYIIKYCSDNCAFMLEDKQHGHRSFMSNFSCFLIIEGESKNGE